MPGSLSDAPGPVVHELLREFAVRVSVSTATVIRCAKKLGFAGSRSRSN
jgi:DNA-binding MurR/RpiR family transcriptional regulator